MQRSGFRVSALRARITKSLLYRLGQPHNDVGWLFVNRMYRIAWEVLIWLRDEIIMKY